MWIQFISQVSWNKLPSAFQTKFRPEKLKIKHFLVLANLSRLNYVLREDGSTMNSKAIWFLCSRLFSSHQNSWSRWLRLLLWYDDWLGLYEEVFAFTDGKCLKEGKYKCQEISKANCFWDFLTLSTWRQWLIFLERFSSILSEMFRCTFSDISLSTKYIQDKYT